MVKALDGIFIDLSAARFLYKTIYHGQPINRLCSYKTLYHDQSAGRILTKQYITANQQNSFSTKQDVMANHHVWFFQNYIIITNHRVVFLQNNIYHNQSAGCVLTKEYMTTNQQVVLLQNNISQPVSSLQL